MPEENYGSSMTGSFQNESIPIQARTNRNSLSIYQQRVLIYESIDSGDISQIGHWWVDEIDYPDGEVLDFTYEIGYRNNNIILCSQTSSPTKSQVKHRI